jgi:hypothetical protein
VNQMFRKPLQFSSIWLDFRRQHVVIPLNRRFHFNTTETPTRNIENGLVPIRQQHRDTVE